MIKNILPIYIDLLLIHIPFGDAFSNRLPIISYLVLQQIHYHSINRIHKQILLVKSVEFPLENIK